MVHNELDSGPVWPTINDMILKALPNYCGRLNLFGKSLSESFFEIDDSRSVLNGLSKNSLLTVICPMASRREPSVYQGYCVSLGVTSLFIIYNMQLL